jgi:hypothetical protein
VAAVRALARGARGRRLRPRPRRLGAQVSLRPILHHLAYFNKLKLPLLRGLARLLTLFSNWFNVTLGARPPRLAACEQAGGHGAAGRSPAARLARAPARAPNAPGYRQALWASNRVRRRLRAWPRRPVCAPQPGRARAHARADAARARRPGA